MHIQLGLSALLTFAMFAESAVRTEEAVQTKEGVLFVETSRYTEGSETTSTIRLLGDRIRFESSSPDDQQVFIYRADMQVMYLINPAERTYQEITREDLAGIANQMSEMTAMMEEQLRNVPPEQRAMMEQMMRDMMPNTAAPAVEETLYTRISTGEQVGNWRCDRYEGRRGNEKIQEVCTTDWRNLDLSVDDFRVFQELGDFFEGLSSQFDLDLYQVGMDPDASGEGTFPGVPVSRTTFANGQASTFHEITEVSRQSFESSIFEVPAGFTRAASPF